MRKHSRIIEVVDYDPSWPEKFRQEAHLIQQVLINQIVSIHHIGSTAVPGLKAKPTIDILLEVKDVTALDAYDSKMKDFGYFAKGEYGIQGRRFYLKGLYERTHHIHAFNAGVKNVLRHLAFRDYLIAKPVIAKKYEKLKIRCAKDCNNDNEKYCLCKNDFVHKYEKIALVWVEKQSVALHCHTFLSYSQNKR